MTAENNDRTGAFGASEEEIMNVIRQVQIKDKLDNLYLLIDNERGFSDGPDMALIDLWEQQIAELKEFGEVRTNTPDSEVRSKVHPSFHETLRKGAESLIQDKEAMKAIREVIGMESKGVENE